MLFLCIFAVYMTHLYIHIPFCRRRCVYCDFYSTTSESKKGKYVDALCGEIKYRACELPSRRLDTIYIGGGTPSQLTPKELEQIFDTVESSFSVSSDAEITMEANPDDMHEEYVAALSSMPVNRISMGVQSFDDRQLGFLRRRHNSKGAVDAYKMCRKYGFENVSMDLMYGLPGQDMKDWEQDVRTMISLRPEHISAYHLIYEEGTPLYSLLLRGKVSEVDEELSLAMYRRLVDMLCDEGYEHYEISNFARRGMESRHNSCYWDGEPYLGCGAAAHSYDGCRRRWNNASLEEYIDGAGHPPFGYEELDTDTKYNDYVMTRLRTNSGISTDEVARLFSPELAVYMMENAGRYIDNGMLERHNGRIRLSREGIFVSDGIMSDLMKV